MIPDEAVEVTAKYLYRSASAGQAYMRTWEDLSEDALNAWKKEATRVLKKAAPSIAAQAWDDGATEQAKCYGMAKDTGPNPFRSKANGPGRC